MEQGIDNTRDTNNTDLTNKDDNNVTQIPVEVERIENNDEKTITSELGSHASSRSTKSGEEVMISDWVRKGLFKYSKFVTSKEDLEYGQALSLFALEENNIVNDQQKWWYSHKKCIVQTLKEKRGCVIDSIRLVFKSKSSNDMGDMCAY